jgi:hypothetical protein
MSAKYYEKNGCIYEEGFFGDKKIGEIQNSLTGDYLKNEKTFGGICEIERNPFTKEIIITTDRDYLGNQESGVTINTNPFSLHGQDSKEWTKQIWTEFDKPVTVIPENEYQSSNNTSDQTIINECIVIESQPADKSSQQDHLKENSPQDIHGSRNRIIEERIKKVEKELMGTTLNLIIMDNNEISEVKVAAIKRLSVLNILSKNSGFKENMKFLKTPFLDGKSNLRLTVLFDKDAKVRLSALVHSKMLSAEDIEYLATNDPDPEVRLVAMSRLNKQDYQKAFEHIAITYKDDDRVVLRAIYKIQESCHALEYLAQSHHNAEVRLAAVKKVQDGSKLLSIAIYDEDLRVVEQAVAGIKDPLALKRIALFHKDKNIKNLAKAELTKIGKEQLTWSPLKKYIYKLLYKIIS